jgi:hypothetical protein
VANFGKLISFTREMGAAYQPSHPELQLTALEGLLAKARQSLGNAMQAKLKYDDAVIARSECFSNLKALGMRVANQLSVSAVPDGKVEDAFSLNKKLTGRRIGKTAANAEGAVVTRSVSQQSFDSRTDFFEKLLALVSAEATYMPNEADLKVEALRAKADDMKMCNQKVVQSAQQWRLALDERDRMLYEGKACLVGCAAAIKRYIKSVNGGSSPFYRAVRGLRIRTAAV